MWSSPALLEDVGRATHDEFCHSCGFILPQLRLQARTLLQPGEGQGGVTPDVEHRRQRENKMRDFGYFELYFKIQACIICSYFISGFGWTFSKHDAYN